MLEQRAPRVYSIVHLGVSKECGKLGLKDVYQCKKFEICTYQGSSKVQENVYFEKEKLHFQKNYTKINFSFNSIFHAFPEIPRYICA